MPKTITVGSERRKKRGKTNQLPGYKILLLREGLLKKKTANYPLFVDKGGGPLMWIRKFLNVNIINFEKVDKPEGGGGSDIVDKGILLNVGTFLAILIHI